MDKLLETNMSSPKPEDLEDPGMNEKRADWALASIQVFQHATGTDAEDAISDFLGDLMHLCDRLKGVDFDAELARGKAHYKYEITPLEEVEEPTQAGLYQP